MEDWMLKNSEMLRASTIINKILPTLFKVEGVFFKIMITVMFFPLCAQETKNKSVQKHSSRTF